ncbi:MAG TPA: SMC family ATPase [bacterium]|nr:SMC family ATPase [bacterium]
MILKEIKASNFMRFENFALGGMPDTGVVGIFGDNECGKSSIGELICFCLFGRTPKAPEGDPKKIIRWGQDTCSTEITVTINGTTVKASRRLSADGSTDGRMIDTSDNSPIATSFDEIEPKVNELLGFTFREFRYSMFIAQKELDIMLHSADDRRLVLNNMLGVGFMEKMAKKVAAKRSDRELEIKYIRERFEEKNEVLDVYRAREMDMERLTEKRDKAAASLTDILKERDRAVSTLSMLEDIRRKAEQTEVLDMRIKSRREQLKRIELECAALMREADRVPAMQKESLEKEALIAEFKDVRLVEIEELFKKIDDWRDMAAKRDQVSSQLELKEAALSDISRKLAEIKAAEQEGRESEAELLGVENFLRAYSDPDSLSRMRSQLMKDIEFLENELERVKTSSVHDADKSAQLIDTLEKQRDRMNRQMSAANVEEIDPLSVDRMRNAELKQTRSRDISLGAAGASLAAGVALTLAMSNTTMLVVMLGMIPAAAAAASFQSKLALTRQTLQDLQRKTYAYEITRRGVSEMSETLDDIETRLSKMKSDSASAEKISNVFSLLRTDSFESLKKSIEVLDEHGLREFERARGLMKDIIEKFSPLRAMAGEGKTFVQIANIESSDLLSDKQRRESDLKARLSELKDIVEPKMRFIEQSEGLLNTIGDIRAQIARIESGMIGLGVTADDEPEARRRKRETEIQLEQLAREIENNNVEIQRIEAQKFESVRLDKKRREIIDHIDEDLIKFYELRENTHKIDCSDRRFAELTSEREEAERQSLEARAQIKEIEAEMGVVKTDLDRVSPLVDEINAIAAELNSKETVILKLRELESLFIQTGLDIRKRMIPQIESYFGWALPKMTRGRYCKVRIAEDFNISVFSDESGGYVELDSLSGGTVDQLLISLRLAFARAAIAHSGDSSQFLFLDEPFSSFDEPRRELFLKLLETLKGTFQQIFLISHLPDLEDFVDHYIRVDLSSSQPVIVSWA